MDDKKRLKEIKESYSNCIDMALSDGETLPSYDIEVADLNYLIQQAEKLEQLKEVIARNLTAWDTSKDKSQGLLPEVYYANKIWYKRLTGEAYVFGKAVKKFNIE